MTAVRARRGLGAASSAEPKSARTASPAGPAGDVARFAEAAAGFSQRRVVVLGDVMLDRYVEGATDRVSPEAPVPVVLVEREWDVPGGAANVAANVRGLGAQCDLVGVAGDDDAGRALARELAKSGVGHEFVASPGRPTPVKTRVLSQGQQVVRVDRERDDDHGEQVADALAFRLKRRLSGADALILADYDKGSLTAGVVRPALDLAAARSIPVVADPKRRRFFAYAGATVLKPNRHELEHALGEPARPDDPQWMERARARAGCRHLLLTLGADGMALASAEGGVDRVRVVPRTVYDVSGAGDTVSAVVAVSLAAGASMGDAVRWSAHGAAAGLATVGATAVTASAIRESLEAASG